VLRTLYCVENYLYVATCWIVSLCAELIVYSELIKLCNTRGYPIPACYPTGTCTGTKFHPRVWSWAGMSCARGYCHGRVFALPAPYPPHCHTYLHSSVILFDQKRRLNNLVSQTIATYPRLFHTSIGISSGPIPLPPFIFFKTFLTSDS
jgi:hypothetical protein